MTDSRVTSTNAPSPETPTTAVSSLESLSRTILFLCLAGAAVVLTYAGYQFLQAKATQQRSKASLIHQIGVTVPSKKNLATEYTDRGGRMLADPPADANKLLDPEVLVVAFDEDSDLDVQPIERSEFRSHLADATGKQVELRLYEHTGDDVAAIRSGKVHVAMVHAADAPYLVNTAGFIPIAAMGSKEISEGNRLKLAVANSSDIRTLADLKGRTLTCTTPASITGHRAAVATLLQKAGLRPSVDYLISFSGGQRRSVLSLAAGEIEVAALSNDKIQSMLTEGAIQEADFRTIYESVVIPRFSIGHVYNLRPELAAKISAAIFHFENKGGPVDESGQQMRFFPTNYQKDFVFMREIDECFDPRLNRNPSKSEAAEAAAEETATSPES